MVSFDVNRIEISFNENLDKNFVKDLSFKLFNWTNQRWIITLSKVKGESSIKEKEKKQKNKDLEIYKKTELYRTVLKNFPDADLVEINNKKEKEDI